MPAFSVCVQYGGGFELFLHVAVIIEDEFCFSIFFFFFPILSLFYFFFRVYVSLSNEEHNCDEGFFSPYHYK